MDLKELDKNGPLPLHWQLREQLREGIEHGRLRPGERLPTEEQLCKRLQISRSPVRQALIALEREGWIFRVQGRGTFVRGQDDSVPTRALLGGGRWQAPLQKAASRLELQLEFSQEPLTTLRQHLIGLVARAQAPDLAVVDSVWVPELAQLEFLTPLDEIDRKWIEEDLRRDVFPSFLTSNSYNGQLYGVPVEADLSLLWYRRDWLQAEGLCPPETWQELHEAALHFKRVSSRYGLQSAPLALPAGRQAGETTSYIFLSLLWSAGGEILMEPQRVRLQGATRVLEFLNRLIETGVLDPAAPSFRWRTCPELLTRGQAALCLGGSYEKKFIQRISGWSEEEFHEHVGFTAIPPREGLNAVPVCGGMSYVIPRQARHATRSLELIREASSPDVMEAFCLETDQNAPRPSVSERLASERDGFLAETSRLLAHARNRPELPIYPRVSNQLQRMIERVLAGEALPEEAVEQAEETLHSLVAPADFSPLIVDQQM